jgi:hypothetical protein
VTVLDAVRLGYNQAGLQLLPVCEDGSKAPDVSSWTALKSTRATLAQMRQWDFAARAGFGMIAGPVSGYRECWDFDGADVFEAFVEAAEACGLGDLVCRIRTGYEDETPGGGRRWIVEYPDSIAWQDCTLARRPGRDGDPKTKTLIELPTFAVLAPSNGATHPSGRPYVRVSGSFDTIARYTADERAALFALARSFDRMPRRAAVRASKLQTDPAGDRPGDHYNQQMTWPQILEPAGWTHVFDRGDVSYWRRPGKDRGISATTNYGGSDLFYPFTSSTLFDPEQAYNKFAAYAVLEHGGDFGQAALALSRQGYGDHDHRDRREASATPMPAAGASWRWLRDVKRTFVEWLWRDRLACGTLTLWIGDGGLGKSRASNDLAARVTTGAPWPDTGAAPLGSVVILSAEDSPSSTIRPAIEAAGGELSRVAILDAVRDEQGTERTFQLSTDLAALEQVIDATQAVLVIIDPLSAYFGTRLDSYRDTDVRAVLEPVAKLAERRHLAILGIMHIGKATDRQARHRALGSVAFVNAARLVFAIGADPEDASRRLFVPVKANLCREAPALAFRLEDADGVARVVWEDAPVLHMNADTVLAGRPVVEDDERHDAEALLRQLLEDEPWPVPAATVAAAGRAHGIHVRSLQRAAHRLGITIRKSSFRAGWLWFRPVAEDDTASSAGSTSEPGKDSAEQTTPKTTEDVSVSVVSSSAKLSSSEAPKTTVSSSSSSSNIQQNTRRREDDTRMSTRAREADGGEDDLPACLHGLERDDSDPIGTHDDPVAVHDAELAVLWRGHPCPTCGTLFVDVRGLGRCRDCHYRAKRIALGEGS